jgi:hypothetical protein
VQGRIAEPWNSFDILCNINGVVVSYLFPAAEINEPRLGVVEWAWPLMPELGIPSSEMVLTPLTGACRTGPVINCRNRKIPWRRSGGRSTEAISAPIGVLRKIFCALTAKNHVPFFRRRSF